MADPVGVPFAPADPPPITRLFIGPRGVRAGWRLLLYAVMVAALGRVLNGVVTHVPALLQLVTPRVTLQPAPQIVQETLQFIAVFVPAMIMGRLERRAVSDYGLPFKPGAPRQFAQGMLWGLLLVSGVIGGIALLHGYDISGLALSGAAIVEFGFFWLIGFTLVGFFEEFTFRGYTQFTLGSGLHFWPAAVVLSAAFGAAHLGNPGEGPIGALMVFLIAMFLCLTLRRTGNLWFAVGLHATFDWGETFLYSVPNSGLVASGHLFASSLHGARWLTGGSVGPEGSVICFVLVGLSIVLFHALYPSRAGVPAGDGVGAGGGGS